MSEGVGVFFILKKSKFSESDLILQALSGEGEKVSFFVKGALRSKKRFGGGVLEPTHLIEIVYQKARQDGGLNLLKEARLVEAFEGLRLDYDRLELALFALDCVSRVSLEGDQNSRVVFQLLGHLFRVLDAPPTPDSVLDLIVLRAQFMVKFLYQQGVLTPESWLEPFLKTSLHESSSLVSLKTSALERIQALEKVAAHYIHHADGV